VAADPPHPAAEGSAKEWPDTSTTPDGKPLREAGATLANLVNRIVAWMKNPPFA